MVSFEVSYHLLLDIEKILSQFCPDRRCTPRWGTTRPRSCLSSMRRETWLPKAAKFGKKQLQQEDLKLNLATLAIIESYCLIFLFTFIWPLITLQIAGNILQTIFHNFDQWDFALFCHNKGLSSIFELDLIFCTSFELWKREKLRIKFSNETKKLCPAKKTTRLYHTFFPPSL